MTISLSAQTRGTIEQHKSVDEINYKKDFDVAGKALIKKCQTAAIAKLALHFKTITNGKASVGKGQNRTTSVTWAMLDGVSEETMQEIADEFYVYVNQKLESELNIKTIGWDQVVAQEKEYSNIQDKQIDKFWDNKNEGAIVVKTANDGPHTKQIVGNPGIWGAYAKLGKALKANPITIDLVIDFAKFDIELSRRYGYSYTTTSASADIVPEISVQYMSGATGFNSMFSNVTFIGKYGEAGIVNLKKNINFPSNFATSIESYNGKMPESMKKSISFGSSLTTGTYIVKADDQLFKAAVLSALKSYIDVVFKKIKEIR